MPRSLSPSPSPSPERHPPVRRRGSGASRMQLHNRNHHHRRPSPSPQARRSLRPRRAAAVSSRPLVDDFFPFPSSPSSSPSRPRQRRPSPEPSSSDSGGASSASNGRRRKLKLVVKLSQLPPDQHRRGVPPPPPYSDDSDGEEEDEVREDGSGDEHQVKPPKKRRIEPRGDRSRHREVDGGGSHAASAPRTKRLPVPGTLRTTPLPDRNALEMILNKLQMKDTYGVFAEPVDPEELPDYHDVIDHPMDFGTVRRKLARNVYRSFEQFEDDIFLICSNAMQYNAPGTIYFRQAHSIQELARKKFQELRDEGIPTENQIRSEQNFGPNSSNREPIKKSVLKYSDDDVGFRSRKEQVKRPNLKGSEDDTSFKAQVKKPISRTLQDESSILYKEQVKKPISRNSEEGLRLSFNKERAKKLVSRNSEDDLSSSARKEQVRKAISRNSENGESSPFHKQQIKKPASHSSKDDSSSHKKQVRKPICEDREDPYFSSCKDPVENSMCINGEDSGVVSTKRIADTATGKNRESIGHSRKSSTKKHICRDIQDDVGNSSNEQAVMEPIRVNSQGALGSDVSGATIASAGDVSNGLSTSQAHATAPVGCIVTNGILDKDVSSPQDEIRSEKTDDISAKPSYKSILFDEARRKSYDTSEEQLPLEPDPVFDVFSVEPKELVNVGVHTDHEHAYARSLARFAGSLGAQGWRIASERIRQALPAEIKYGRGWVGEYEPMLPSVLIVNDQSRSLKSSEGNAPRNVSLPRDNMKFRQTERNNPKDLSLSLLNRINTGNNVVGVPGPLESPEFKPRIFGVTAESLHGGTNALLPHENHRVSGKVAKAKRKSSEQIRKCNSSSARPLEMQPQRPDCSKEASTCVLDMPSLNKVTGQPRLFFQPPEAARTQQILKSNIPIETAPQRPECSKGVSSGVHGMPSLNGQPKPFFQPQEATTPQPKNETTWVYHGRPDDGKVGSSKRSGPSTSVGFISNNQAVNAATSAMNVSGQKNFSEHANGVHGMPSSNGQPKPFFQSQEATTPQPKNETTWVYHGRPDDGKVGSSKRSGPSTSVGFISNNQAVNAATFAMDVSGQKNFSEHAKSVGSIAVPGQANITNSGLDASRNMFSAFPAAVRENQSIPSAPGAQSWISFGASSENKPAIISPSFLDNNSSWKMPFANVRLPDDAKSVVPQFFRQPVQVARESLGQKKGLVIFPQLVQTDFLTSQGQSQWQGLIPHLQQKPSKDVLRPDLNIGFPSPGSPPAPQSSGINLEPQQPDLALQL